MVRFQTLGYKPVQKIVAAGVLASASWALKDCANAQVISAQDAVQTQVVRQNDRFAIFDGTLTDNNKLLFHSFEQFDLEPGFVAEFNVNPGVAAVFSRVTNGAVSQINGLVELIGSPASLFLINPAGVVFGSEATLNLAGDFAILTAERLDFDAGYFSLDNHPSDVQGNVLQLHFDQTNPGHIVNLGTLRGSSQHSLSFVGHSVLNQGTISGGAINIAAISGQSAVFTDGFQLADRQQALPAWLTPAGTEHAAAIEVDQNGAVRLTGASLLDLPSGTALVGGNLTTAGASNRIQVLGDRVITAGATLRAADGGQILIGGGWQGQSYTAQSAFIDAATTLRADGEVGGQVVVWSDGLTDFRGTISTQGNEIGGTVEVSGKEQLYFGGLVDLRSQGTPGTLLLDPENIEIRSGRDPGGTSEPQILYEETLESSILGDTNLILQADNDITIAPLADGALTFVQGTGRIQFIADADNSGQGSFTMAPSDSLVAPGRDISITAADISVGKLSTATFSAIDNFESAGDIQLTATQGNIVSNSLVSTARSTLNNNGNGGDIFLSASGSIVAEEITTAVGALNNNGSSGDIALAAETGSITTNALNTEIFSNNNTGASGNVEAIAANNILTDDITTAVITVTNNSRDAGSVSLVSQTGNITTGSIATSTAADSSNTGNAGPIALTATQGAVTAQRILSTTVSPDLANTLAGDINISADDSVILESINATGQGQGGDISVTTQNSLQAFGVIPDIISPTSLLTSDSASIRLTYASSPDNPFVLGENGENSLAGSIVTGSESLEAPQTVGRSLSLNTIELNNLFEAPDLPLLPVQEPSAASFSDALPIKEAAPLRMDFSSTESPASNQSLDSSISNLSNLDNLVVSSINNFNGIAASSSSTEREGDVRNSELIWAQIEQSFSAEFARALNLPVPASPSLQAVQMELKQVKAQQKITPVLIYIRVKESHVELVMISGDAPPVYYPVAVSAAELRPVVETFHQTVTNPILRPAQYLPAAQQLYDWLVRPMLNDLEQAKVDHIGFVLDAGLRSVPMAALHDGQAFLIENYSIGLLPSAGLTNLEPSWQSLSQSSSVHGATLAMGIESFEHQADLTAVPFELALASQNSDDENYLDHEATLDALRQRLEQGKFTNVHLATHAVFQPGSLEDSHVQLWDRAVSLDQLQSLPLDTVDFLILSACATALGDPSAEFGFAGLAVGVGVQTALASLWSISDEGTLGLMAEFYRALEQPLTRSAALRQAQLAMLRGKVATVNGTVYGSGNRTVGYLPNLATSGSWDFSHPAYWSGFTMIGNPW